MLPDLMFKPRMADERYEFRTRNIHYTADNTAKGENGQ